ncbi:MAG: hypothetical protein ABIQ44_04710 [Chloroflexia bacterium]
MSVNTLERDVARLLHEGQSAARRGDRAMARALLTQLVEQDPRNEEAWMWLSGVVDNPDEQQICLENALVINPYNAHARKGLDFVLTKTNTPARVPMLPPAPETSSPASSSMSAAVSAPEQPQTQVSFDDAPAGFAASAMPVPVNPDSGRASETPFHDGLVDLTESHPIDYSTHSPVVAASPSNADAFDLSFEDASLDFDGQPFIPPGMEDFGMPSASNHPTGPTGTLLGATADQIGDELPSWLQDLTPTRSNTPSEPLDTPYSPFNMPDYAAQQQNGVGMPGMQGEYGAAQNSNAMNGYDNGNGNGMNAMQSAPAPAQPFGPIDFGDMPDLGGPVGPFSDLQMPMPHELPGGQDGFSHSSPVPQTPQKAAPGSAQPWYLQQNGPQRNPNSQYLDSTMLKSSSLNSAMLSSKLEELRKNVATMPCPNCHDQVNETALACPNCRYSFFANCPFCHELLDTGEAVPGQIEPCPYCAKDVDKFNVGLGGFADLVSQRNPGSRPGDSGKGPDPAFPAMKQTLQINTQQKKGLRLGWLVDVLWLVAIVAMVWALTQLPTWLHLSGQY